MKPESLRERLRREAREYLADIRAFIAALKHLEGWFTLGLIVAVIVMLVVWFSIGLGFDRLAHVAGSLGVSRGRVCPPLSDFSALVLIADAMAMTLLAIMALGEMMRLLDRMRQRLPARPRAVALPAFFMLVAGIAGIVYMRSIC